MYTRKQYIANEVNRREYFGQFVDKDIKEAILNYFTLERLLSSKDEHLNDIPLQEWDHITGYEKIVSYPLCIHPELRNKLRETGENISASGLVCIYKEAAKQIIETAKQGG